MECGRDQEMTPAPRGSHLRRSSDSAIVIRCRIVAGRRAQ